MEDKKIVFVFYESYFDALFSIDDIKGRDSLIKGIYNYLKFNRTPKLSGQAKTCFLIMKPLLDKSSVELKTKVKAGNPNFIKGKPNPYYAKKLSNNYQVEASDETNVDSDNSYNFDNNYLNTNINENINKNINNKEKTTKKEVGVCECCDINFNIAENESFDSNNLQNPTENDENSATNSNKSVKKLKNELKNDKKQENCAIIGDEKDMEKGNNKESFIELAASSAKSISEVGPATEDSEKQLKMKDKMPPSLDDIKNYCKEYNLVVDPEVFFNFYESKGWLIGNTPMWSYRAALRSWQKTAEYRQRAGESIAYINSSKPQQVSYYDHLTRTYKGYEERKYDKSELDDLFDDLDDDHIF